LVRAQAARAGRDLAAAICEIMIDQSRAIDNARLKRRLGVLPRTVLAEVQAKLKRLGDL
jgi:mRNA-degrading endonuclease toxin of MazEF toxin-antitoxin module